MSAMNTARTITETKLKDGTTVHVNGEPYAIGRVMEFCSSHKGKGLYARIAWYMRMKDIISNRKAAADLSLLVATMHSEVHPVSSICGKCTVTHKHYVASMDVYRKQPGNYYYHQLFDRFTQRLYDVVPCETVQNLPKDTLEALNARYHFIAVEQGKAADLKQVKKTCGVCQLWCQSAMSVQCTTCHKHYHMACLTPRLVRKPPRGFAWQCASYTRQAQTAESSSSSKASSPKMSDSQQQTAKETSIATRSQVRQQQQESQATTIQMEGSQAQHIKMTNMWPFRYFDVVNTTVAEILDVDDRINPRPQSRIGSNYQIDVPDFMPPSSGSSRPSSFSSNVDDQQDMAPSSSGSRTHPTSTSSMRPIRGTDKTVTAIYRPGILDDSTLDRYMDSVKQLDNIPLLPHNSDLMDRALSELEHNDYDTDAAYDSMSKLDGPDFEHIVEWTPTEKQAFEQSIREHGHNFDCAKAAVKTKSMADIVRYFYQWKKTDRYQPVYSEWTQVHKPRKAFKAYPQDSSRQGNEKEQADPFDLTIVPKSTYASANYHCINCRTEQSSIWRRSPSDFIKKQPAFDKVLCNDCGVFWLKYAKMKPVLPKTRIANSIRSTASSSSSSSSRTSSSTSSSTSSVSRLGDKRKSSESHASSVKRRLTNDNNNNSSNEHMKLNPSPCVICNSTSGPPSNLYTCCACGMSVHHDCYGIKSNTERNGWHCDPCQNKRKPVGSYNYECVLCYNTTSSHQALKMTSGYCWAHVQCAAFIPEVKFVDPSTLSPVEYIGCVNPARTETQCSLCNEQRGACVACPECHKSMHVQCAVNNHYRLLFDIASPNPKNAHCPTIPAGHFSTNTAAGIMAPQVICPSHSLAGKQLVRMEERTNNKANESALHTYCNYFKRISSSSTPAMRRYLAVSSSEHKHGSKKALQKLASQLDAVVDSLTMDASLLYNAESHQSRSKAIFTSLPLPSTSSSSASSATSSSLSSSSSSSRTCSRCPAKFSPIWWSVGSGPYSVQRVCQRCHNKEQQHTTHQ
ncbi:hypothetical protein MBANPS3_009807 [Mucor bainieri]